jgi:hypothetical protein
MDVLGIVFCTIVGTLLCVLGCTVLLGQLASVQRESFLDAPAAAPPRRLYTPLQTTRV